MSQRIDLGELVLTKVADYKPLVMENERGIADEAPKSLVWVKGDRSALESIIGNLLDNALRAEPSGGVVIVRVKPEPRIEICDHGPGIAEADRVQAFEPFWRKNDAGAGSRLGLAIVKELVDAHHGKIWIEETLAGGATFVVSLSRARSAP